MWYWCMNCMNEWCIVQEQASIGELGNVESEYFSDFYVLFWLSDVKVIYDKTWLVIEIKQEDSGITGLLCLCLFFFICLCIQLTWKFGK